MKLCYYYPVLLLFAVVLLLGCSKKQHTNTVLTGNWRFVSGYGGWSGPYTPATLGHELYRVYNTQDQCVFIQDGRLQGTFRYTFVYGVGLNPNSPDPIIHYQNGPLDESFTIRNDSLFVEQQAYDASSEVYVRVP